MRIFGIFSKNKNDKNSKKELPKECPSVISHGGRIARVGDRTAEMTVDTVEQTSAAKSNYPEEMAIEAVDIRTADYKEEKAGRKKTGIHTVSKEKRTPFPVATIVIFLFCTVLVMTTVVNMVQIDGYSKEVKKLEKQMKALEETKTELTAELAEKNDVEILKNYIGELGMVSEAETKGQITIVPDSNESITDFETEEESKPVVSVVLSAVMGNLIDALNVFLK